MTAPSSPTDLSALVAGPVLGPDDDGFAAELSGFNLAYEHRPQLVVGATSVADVQAAVRWAGEHDLPVRVLATGHGAHERIVDGLVLSLRRLDAVSVDATAHAAEFEGGTPWAAVVAAAAEHGLAPITGSSMTVGATGFLLGGGVGPLARSHGFGSDRVLEVTLVNADGEVVVADAHRHPDLFWALRGGKGGFGVVVGMRIRLVELPTVFGGAVAFGERDLAPVLRGWIAWTATAPDDVTTSVLILRFPPLPDVPEPMRGRTLLMLRFAYPGDADEGARLAAPLLALGSPEFGGFAPLPAAEIGSIHGDPTEPSFGWGLGMLLTDLDAAFAETVVQQVGPDARTPLMGLELRHLGAATARDVPGGSAVGGRSGSFAAHAIGVPEPSLFATALPEAGRRFEAAIRPWIAAETTPNYLSGTTLEEFTRAWPADTFARLERVRAQWDPSGRFPFGPPRPPVE